MCLPSSNAYALYRQYDQEKNKGTLIHKTRKETRKEIRRETRKEIRRETRKETRREIRRKTRRKTRKLVCWEKSQKAFPII